MTTTDTATTMPQGRMAVVGMFDGVHLGHRYLLANLRDIAVTRSLQPFVLTFSNHPLEIIAPGRAPLLLTSPHEKARLIGREGVECEVMEFTPGLRQASAEEFIAMLASTFNTKVLLMGYNNRFGHNAPADFNEYRRLGERQGVEVIAADEFVADSGLKISSTEIRNLLLDGDVATANSLLGRPYTMSGIVEHGRQLGRTIGFPTANLRSDFPRRLVPKAGVYATETLGHRAMTNIGVRPTVDLSGAPQTTVETHIIGCDANLYGRPLELAFHRYLRPERRFASIDELRLQLEADRLAAQSGL